MCADRLFLWSLLQQPEVGDVEIMHAISIEQYKMSFITSIYRQRMDDVISEKKQNAVCGGYTVKR